MSVLSDKSSATDTGQGDQPGLILSPLLIPWADALECKERLNPNERGYKYFLFSNLHLHQEFVFLIPNLPLNIKIKSADVNKNEAQHKCFYLFYYQKKTLIPMTEKNPLE